MYFLHIDRWPDRGELSRSDARKKAEHWKKGKHMKLAYTLRFALATLVLAGSATVVSATDYRVRIHNDAGYTLYKFYSTNSGAKKWGSDVLGKGTLANGAAMTLNFDNADGYCVFDFRAVFEDGTELQRGGVNVCEVSDYYYQ